LVSYEVVEQHTPAARQHRPGDRASCGWCAAGIQRMERPHCRWSCRGSWRLLSYCLD